MKRDITVALIIGFIIGTIAAFSIINLPSLLKNQSKPNKITEISPTIKATNIPAKAADIEIASPAEGDVFDQKNIKISGKTKADTLIIIESENDQIASLSGKDGSFNENLTLLEGANPVEVSAYSENGDVNTKTITVFYTPEKI